MADEKIQVAYTSPHYAALRMIINKTDGVVYKWVKKNIFVRLILKILTPVITALVLHSNRIFFYYISFYKNRLNKDIDVLHSYNKVCKVNKPWIVSFEHITPGVWTNQDTYHSYIDKSIGLLLSPACKRLLPLSRWAYNREIEFLSVYLTDTEMNSIRSKMEVLYPPQNIIVDESEVEKYKGDINDGINFVFVGRDIWRKGGVIAINALSKLKAKGARGIKLTVVSSLNTGGAEKWVCDEDIRELRRYLKNNAEWITWCPGLENERVIDILKRCHVGLLPTLGDTFGFSVLEMQAAGVPCITTSPEALPEINNEEVGWIMSGGALKNKNQWDLLAWDREEAMYVEDTLSSELLSIIEHILEDPSVIISKGKAAIRRIKKQHSPAEYGRRMLQIYTEAAE